MSASSVPSVNVLTEFPGYTDALVTIHHFIRRNGHVNHEGGMNV